MYDYYFFNKTLNTIYFYSKNVYYQRMVKMKNMLRLQICIVIMLPQLVCLAVQISCYKFMFLFQKLAQNYLVCVLLFRISHKGSRVFS